MSSVTVPNVVIIIVMVFIPLVAAVISMVIMCLLQSPIDYNQAWIPKIVVVCYSLTFFFLLKPEILISLIPPIS